MDDVERLCRCQNGNPNTLPQYPDASGARCMVYVCVACDRETPYCDGAGDDLFDFCDECANAIVQIDALMNGRRTELLDDAAAAGRTVPRG